MSAIPEGAVVYEKAYPRDGWVPGPWDAEPDKVVWVDEATDLDCMVRRGGGGAWCGYVGVPTSHPWHGDSYNDVPGHVSVHGGLTFAADCDDDAEPSTGICHVPEPGRDRHVWWFGFDCAHAFDLVPRHVGLYDDLDLPAAPERDVYRDLAYVVAETRSLAEQLRKVAP